MGSIRFRAAEPKFPTEPLQQASYVLRPGRHHRPQVEGEGQRLGEKGQIDAHCSALPVVTEPAMPAGSCTAYKQDGTVAARFSDAVKFGFYIGAALLIGAAAWARAGV